MRLTGGGFFIKEGSTHRLQGVTSASMNTSQQVCETNDFVVFTKVSLFNEWIKATVAAKWTYIDLQCESYVPGWVDLISEWSIKSKNVVSFMCSTCFTKFDVFNDNIKVKSISDVNNDDLLVKKFLLITHLSGDTFYLPSNIGAFLPNLRIIECESSILSFLKRSNFKFMRKVASISMPSNQVSSIDEDSFYDLPSLRTLGLRDNKIKLLPPKLLHESRMLSSFSVPRNQIEIIPKDFFINNNKLTSVNFDSNVLKTILVDFTMIKQLNYLTLSGNVCINRVFGQYGSLPFNATASLQFQDVINSNCITGN